MELSDRHIDSVYFLGIGGIGMSALARYFQSHGIAVSGYDKTESHLTGELLSEGMALHFEDNPAKIPSNADMAIYTPAIPENLKEFTRIRQLGVPLKKRAEVLGMITRDKFTLAIGGTHGKTSITAMVAHILMTAGKPVSALLGGISKNYGTNFITSGKEELMVVEADEFDRSFLQLYPDLAVISSMDADHLDIYESREGMVESFCLFVEQVRPDGIVIFRHDLESELPVYRKAVKYSPDKPSDFTLKNIRISNGKYHFIMEGNGVEFPETVLGVPGRHNVENALAASSASTLCGVSPQEITRALSTFTGVSRRFDIRLDLPGKTYIDDYAHHPRELNAFISSVKELFPDRKVTGIFQPHLYSRTRDFATGFAESLDLLDEAILMEIYPAREKPIPGVTSALIYQRMKLRNKHLVNRKDLQSLLEKLRPSLLLTMGAGDIDLFVEPIEKQMWNWP